MQKQSNRKPPRARLLAPLPLRQVPPGHATPSPSDGGGERFRIATPQSDRSHLGELLFAAGVMPHPTANTPQLLVHPTSIISPWTKGENMSRLGHYLSPMDDEDGANTTRPPLPPVRTEPLSKTYLTDQKKPPLANANNVNGRASPQLSKQAATPTGKLPPLASAADVLAALQALQDSLRGAQSASAHAQHGNDAVALCQRDDRSASPPNEEAMTPVELWRFKHDALPSGVHTPTFDNEDRVRVVPSKYIQRRMYDIRLDPQKWFELKERVAALEESRADAASFSMVTKNRRLAGSTSPGRRRENIAEKKRLLQCKLEQAQRRRDALDDERCASNMTHEARQRLRHAQQAERLVVLVAFGARFSLMLGVVLGVRGMNERATHTRAAAVIQRAVRKYVLGRVQLTPVQAFIIRARIMRRFVTGVKARVLLPKYATILTKFLRGLRFESRILVGFRKLHQRVVTAQRLVRRWLNEKSFLMTIRTMQWDKCIAKRLRDFSVMSAKGSSLERDLANRELEDLRAITDEVRRNVLERFRADSRAAFFDAMRVYAEAMREVKQADGARTAALLRKAVPPKPVVKILVPAEVVERMVRTASRQVRLQRQIATT